MELNEFLILQLVLNDYIKLFLNSDSLEMDKKNSDLSIIVCWISWMKLHGYGGSMENMCSHG